ncbi:MAG: GntR family transcriptional regulator [Streptosporangiaceae bacterium]
MIGNHGGDDRGRPGDGLPPLRRRPLYAQVERVLENLLVRGRYRVGDRIPPETELVEHLGVSRATLRAAVGRLVDRGVLTRRQGSGTFLAHPPEGNEQASPVGIRLGSAVAQLGRLETYTAIAERLGLKIDSEQLRVGTGTASHEEAVALELPEGSRTVRVSRVLLIDSEPSAWMIDVLPVGLLPVEKIKQRLSPDWMLLDLLLDEGIPVGSSEVEVDAAMLNDDQRAGRALGLAQPTAMLALTETIYLDSAAVGDGRPVQLSRNLFLPDKLSLRLVRETPGGRSPTVILRLLDST